MKMNQTKTELALLGGKKIRNKPFHTLPIIGKEEYTLVKKVLDSRLLSGFIAQPGERFLGGPMVRRLEELYCKYFNSNHAVAMNSATSALHAALAAVGAGAGDEVIVPPYTMSASATAILMQKAIPVFADIDEDIFCISPQQIEAKITSRTKAILVVHLFGQAAEMDEIKKIARKNRLFVIEDCAQAPGVLYKGRKVGTIGEIGVFSLNQHKIITCGEGGVAVTNNSELALRLQLVRNHGEVVTAKMGQKVFPDIIGCNYRLTEIDAAIAIAQFKRLDRLTGHRIRLAKHLTRKLKGLIGITPPKVLGQNKHVYFVYPVKFNQKEAGVSRALFIKALTAEGIPCSGGYVRPIYLEPVFKRRPGHKKGNCPVTERMHYKELIILPVSRSPHTIKDMDMVADAFKKVLRNTGPLKKYEKGSI